MKRVRTLAAIGVVLGIILLAAANGFAALAGDVDGSGTVDLKDTMMSFQISIGVTPLLTVNRQADVDGDGAIGIEEAIYGMEVAANLRDVLRTWYKDADGDRISDGTTLISETRPSSIYFEETELYLTSGDPDDTAVSIVTAVIPSELTVVQSFIQKNEAAWTAASNPVSELPQILRQFHLGAVLPDPTPKSALTKFRSKHVRTILPSSFDWRTQNKVTPIRDQGNCGSCWAFATTAALESQVLISNGTSQNLSEQIVVSCSDAGSCDGGYISTASNFLKNTGTNLETCYPYSQTNGTCAAACSNWQNSAYSISNWTYVNWGEPATILEIKQALYETGPLVSTLTVYEDFFYYKSGVYSYTYGTVQGGHAILIVGWDDTASCFIVKNSWNTGWGESGYFRISYNELNGKTGFGGYTLAYYSTPSCTYTISPTSASVNASGGTGSVSVTAQSGCTWTASSNATWISITSGTSGTGSGTVSYLVSANTGTSQRPGTLTIAGKTFTITQDGITCSYTISPTTASVNSSGGTGTVSVTTSSGCTWTASSNAAWISITSGASGNGSGTVSYSVAANTSTSSRTGTLTIAGQTFTITQPSPPITCTDNDGDGYSTNGGSCGAVDCNDANAAVHPGALETCNSIDDNCNGLIDDGVVMSTYYRDSDSDSYGNSSQSIQACSQPAGYVTNNTDCNDSNASIHPNATEIRCDNVDQDCNGKDDCVTETIFEEKFDTDPFTSGRWIIVDSDRVTLAPGTVVYRNINDPNNPDACGTGTSVGYIYRQYRGTRYIVYAPGFSSTGYQDLKLTFWYRNDSGTSIQVEAGVNGQWVPIPGATVGQSSGWQKKEVSLSNGTHGIIFILISDSADTIRRLDCISITGKR